jgi:hypothetical protein
VSWLSQFLRLPGVAGGVISATATLGAAWFVTSRLNTSMKRTEFYSKFNERYHALMNKKHILDTDPIQFVKTQRSSRGARLEKEAHRFYHEFFDLILDEFNAYRSGFLDRRVFAEWMKWRRHQFQESAEKFNVCGLTYNDGWDFYSKYDLIRPDFIKFMNAVHSAKSYDNVERLVANCGALQPGLLLRRAFSFTRLR